jgi:hypothetical protein
MSGFSVVHLFPVRRPFGKCSLVAPYITIVAGKCGNERQSLQYDIWQCGFFGLSLGIKAQS